MFAERLKIALKRKNMKQSVLAYRVGVDRSYISNYLSGRYKPNADIHNKIASVLGVSAAWLSGFDVPMIDENIGTGYGTRAVTKRRFQMLGEIACGEPIFCNQEWECFVDASADIDADFCLTARGDSMIDARIRDGDVVFIKQMPIVPNGTIAAVVIDGQATLKKWYYYPESKKLVLNPANQNYEPLVFTGAELDSIICLGRAVCFMSNL